MLQDKKGFPGIKFLMISVLAVSLAACSNDSETSSTPSDSASSPSTPTTAASSPPTSTTPTIPLSTPSGSTTPSTQTTPSPVSIAIPGVKDLREIKFAVIPNSTHGFFDGVSNDNIGPKITVQKTATFKVSGWAVLSKKDKPADLVLITDGKTNAIVAVVPVSLPRPDVAKALKHPSYGNSGWSTELNASNLTTNSALFNGWAYNSTTKEATRFNNLLQVVVLNQ